MWSRAVFSFFSGSGVLAHSFCPSCRAFTGQFSTHWPQATHFSASTTALKFERMASGVLNSVAMRMEKHAQPQQLQMAKHSPSSSVWGPSCIRPMSSAFLMISSASWRVISRPRPVEM